MVDLNRLKISDGERHGFTLGKGMILLLIFLLLIGFFSGHYLSVTFPWELRIHTVKTMVARKSKPVSVSAFTAGGWIEASAPKYPYYVMTQIHGEILQKIYVKEGDIVKPGMCLAEIYSANKKLAMDLAKAKWESCEANLSKLKNGYRQEEIEGARGAVKDVQAQLAVAKLNLARSEKLGRDVVAQTQIDEHRAQVRALTARLDKNQAQLDLLLKGYRDEDIAIAQAETHVAKIAYEQTQLVYDFCFIHVPEGMPEMRVLKVYAKEGQMLMSEDRMGMILSLYDPQNMQARVDIRQQNIKQVAVGGPVLIRTDADISKQYHGTVLRIDPEADIAKNTVAVKIKINDPDLFLFPDMIAQISFLVPEYIEVDEEEDEDAEDTEEETTEEETATTDSGVTDASDAESTEDEEEYDDEEEEDTSIMMIPQNAVYLGDDGVSFVWVNDNGKAAKRPITISKTVEGKVTVSGGLPTGSRVIISDASALRVGDDVKEEE